MTIKLPSSLVVQWYIPLNKAGGPYIGPRGGKWANPERTIPWRRTKGRGKKKVAGPLRATDVGMGGPAHEGRVSAPSTLADYVPPEEEKKEIPQSERLSPYMRVKKKKHKYYTDKYGDVRPTDRAYVTADREGGRVLSYRDYFKQHQDKLGELQPALRHLVAQTERRQKKKIDPHTVEPPKVPAAKIQKLLDKEARSAKVADAPTLTAKEQDILLQHRLHSMRHKLVVARNRSGPENVDKAISVPLIVSLPTNSFAALPLVVSTE